MHWVHQLRYNVIGQKYTRCKFPSLLNYIISVPQATPFINANANAFAVGGVLAVDGPGEILPNKEARVPKSICDLGLRHPKLYGIISWPRGGKFSINWRKRAQENKRTEEHLHVVRWGDAFHRIFSKNTW